MGNERFQSRLKSGQWEKGVGGVEGSDGWSGGWKRQLDRIVRDGIIQQVNGGRRKGRRATTSRRVCLNVPNSITAFQ